MPSGYYAIYFYVVIQIGAVPGGRFRFVVLPRPTKQDKWTRLIGTICKLSPIRHFYQDKEVMTSFRTTSQYEQETSASTIPKVNILVPPPKKRND